MFDYLLYFSIVLALFVFGDWCGIKTRAKISSIFVVLICFLLLFVFKIIPADIIDRAGLTAAAKWASPILIFHMGTMINLRQLLDEWRTVVTSIIGMAAAIAGILLATPLIGRDAALVSIPVINGALIATQIMTDAAVAKGLTVAAILPAVVFAVQKFVGTPVVSRAGLLEGRRLLAEFRAKKAEGVTLSASTQPEEAEDTGKKAKVKFWQKHERAYTTNVCLFITVAGSLFSVWLGSLIKLNYSIVALVLSVILCEMGVIPTKVLDRGKASGFITMVVFAAIIPALAKISPANIATLAFYVVIVFAATLIAVFLVICVLPFWKVMGSRSLAFGVAMCQMLGFPSTYLISNEIALALADTDEEKEYLLGKIMPRFVVAGLSSVTTLSIIVAGIFASIL
ncbi:MAG: hypothetical protein ACOYD9_01795 [Pyramidobacter sp.]|jgi:hypothetical protein